MKIEQLIEKYLTEKKFYYSNYDEYTTAVGEGRSGYIWRANDDEKVRHSHLEMDGKFVPYDKPPTLDGLTFHAGEGYNCRCWQEQINQ